MKSDPDSPSHDGDDDIEELECEIVKEENMETDEGSGDADDSAPPRLTPVAEYEAATVTVHIKSVEKVELQDYNDLMKNRRHHHRKNRSQNKSPSASGRTWEKIEDPNSPRRPRSAYVHFLSRRRAYYGSTHKNLTQKSINVALAADWQALTPEGRKPYADIAHEEREAYDKAMEVYVKSAQFEEFQKRKQGILKQRKDKRRSEGSTYDDSLIISMSNEENSGKKRKKNRASEVEMSQNRMFCPLFDTRPSSSGAVGTYTGEIFSKEFVDYNKTRENYRRQLQTKRATMEEEQKALHKYFHHDLEHTIKNDEVKAREADETIDSWRKSVSKALVGLGVPYGSLSTSESMVSWLETVASNPSTQSLVRSVRDAISRTNFNN